MPCHETVPDSGELQAGNDLQQRGLAAAGRARAGRRFRRCATVNDTPRSNGCPSKLLRMSTQLKHQNSAAPGKRSLSIISMPTVVRAINSVAIAIA